MLCQRHLIRYCGKYIVYASPLHRLAVSRRSVATQRKDDIFPHHPPTPPLMIGSHIGSYEILDQLGQGGMGIVYKARDTQLDRVVALKFLPGHLSQDEGSRKRFVQEAKAASALDHANICTIHHIGETEDGATYIVMSYYEGQTPCNPLGRTRS